MDISLKYCTAILAFCIFSYSYTYGQNCSLDVFVANDQSGSVSSIENSQSRRFITSLMEGMQPWGNDPGESRMSIAQWASPGTWVQFPYPSVGPNYTTFLSDVIAYQNAPRILTGGTGPYGALLNTYNAINQTPIPNRISNKIIVLMTDAACTQVPNGIVDLATQIKNEGIFIIVVAIESASSCTILAGENVASPGGYFSSTNYASLIDANVQLVQDIIATACLGPISPTFDLTVSLDSYTATNCNIGGGTYTVNYTINNAPGAGEEFNDDLLISFYDGDPKLPTTSLIATQNIGTQTIPIAGSYSGSFNSPLLLNSATLYAIVNYDGSIVGNETPVPPYLFGETFIPTERITSNNFSNGITRTGDPSCPPHAILYTDVVSGGIGCDDLANYYVTICNTGDANAFISTSLPIPVLGATLISDTTQPLEYTINLLWASYYGGTSEDYGYSVATDATGNVYVAGSTESNSSIATAGAHLTNQAGGSDAFLVKFDAVGVRLWGTYYGGDENDNAHGVATDNSGNVYIVGNTESLSGIATAGAYQTSHNNSDDCFIAKFNSSGVRQWASYYGGSDVDFGLDVATDASGDVYLAGFTEGSTTLASAGSHQTSFGGNSDEFIVKFNSSGARQWATYYGGTGEELEPKVTTDVSGNVYLTGRTQSNSAMATAGSHQSFNNGDDDVFVAKFNSSGVRQWGSYYGGTNSELTPCVTTDQSGNVYLGGKTNSTSSISTSGAHQQNFGGSWDGFIAKFNTNGVRQWASYYGGSAEDGAGGIATDQSGNVYLTGPTMSSAGMATAGAYQTVVYGQDAFLTKLSPSGTRAWGTYYGGPGAEEGFGLAVDASNSIYLCGFTPSTSNVATTGAHQTAFGGDVSDAFLAKFNEREIGSIIYANECVTRQYTFDLSGVSPGMYDFSFGVTADTVNTGEVEPVILPDSNFNAGIFTNVDGFNGALHSSDDITVVSGGTSCPIGDQISINVDIPPLSNCGNGNFVQALITINNTSGVNVFNTSLHLNLTGTGASFAGELYNISTGLNVSTPAILDPLYPAVPYALYSYSGNHYLPISQIPIGTSTFNIDLNAGSNLTNLSAQIDSIHSAFNANGQSNLASDTEGLSISSNPIITGFNCPASINNGNTVTFSGISASHSNTVIWSSTSVTSILNIGTLTNPSITYVPTPVDLANGFVAISLTVISSGGCETTQSCQILINNVANDYGDAPITYDLNTNVIPNAGASTLFGLFMGTNSPTAEPAANSSPNADGDGMEEDGLINLGCNSQPIATQAFNLNVEATNISTEEAYISAFIDWNSDGSYLADSETVASIVIVPASSGTNNYNLPFWVSSDLDVNASQFFVRLRISTDSNYIKRPYGAAPQGEIEDHIIAIGGSPITNLIDTTICNGHSVTIGSNTYSTTGIYYDTLLSSAGCDSIITSMITVADLNPHQGLYLGDGSDFFRADKFSGTILDTINNNPLSVNWLNNMSAIHERGRKLFWISDDLNFHSLDLETGLEDIKISDIDGLDFIFGMQYFNGYLYFITTNLAANKVLVRIDTTTGNLDPTFTGIEISNSSNYAFSIGSTPVINPANGKYYISTMDTSLLEFDILGGFGQNIQLTGLIPYYGVINLLEINQYSGQMYGLNGFSEIVNITLTSPVSADVTSVKMLTTAAGYSNPISAFDSENNIFIFQAVSGCASNPIVAVDVTTGQEWCSDPPGISYKQMEFLNCAPTSQLRISNSYPEMEIYPNPVKNDLTLMLSLEEQHAIQIRISNLIGNTIYEKKFEGEIGSNTIKLDVSSLNSGQYLIHVISGGKANLKSIIKI